MAIERNPDALHPVAGGMVTISIPNEIARLKESSEWKSGIATPPLSLKIAL